MSKKVYELKDYVPLDAAGNLVVPDEENSWDKRRRLMIASLERDLARETVPSKVLAIRRAIAIWERDLVEGEPADIDAPRSLEVQKSYGKPGRPWHRERERAAALAEA